MRTGASYGRSLILTGDRRKLGYFAQANMGRFGAVRTAGALGGLGAPPGFNLDAEGGKSSDWANPYSAAPLLTAEGCPAGMRMAPNGQCISTQSASGSGFDVSSVTSFVKNLFSGGSGGGSATDWANPYPARQVPQRTGFPVTAAAGIGAGLLGVYFLVKKKPTAALAAGAASLALVFLPKMLGSSNPFAGVRPGNNDDSVLRGLSGSKVWIAGAMDDSVRR